MSAESISAISDTLPPATDYLTYLTVVESHLSPGLLPTLNAILQDANLTQNIGWDLIQPLLPLPGAEQCLGTIARLGNPREVVLKVTEALQLLDPISIGSEGSEGSAEETRSESPPPSEVDKFCLLVNLLSILHPRIKTKYPSRFLSTSLMAMLAAFRPSNQATLAIVSFVSTLSGKKRPPLPGRQSSLSIPTASSGAEVHPSAPDPEAQGEEPGEPAIQSRLLQSFVTHVLEDYVNANSQEWAARLQESLDPAKVVPGKTTLCESFNDEPALVTRQAIAGQLVALLRDLGLSNYKVLFDAIYRTDEASSEANAEESYPSRPESIPLSRAGSLFFIASSVISSTLFGSQIQQPDINIFPDHAMLLKNLIHADQPQTIGSEEPGVIDALLAIGIWLETTNKFVSGPLEDEDFLQHLQSLSLLSANNPSPTLRYAAHVLTSSILHAHPVDRLRLTFISDTLEECPYESLKASAVSWLKQEIITARQRNSGNIFSSSAALTAVQPYLFPENSSLTEVPDEDMVQELAQSFPFHMAAVNFLYFVSGQQYNHVIPPGMEAIVQEVYLKPLKHAQEKAFAASRSEGDSSDMKVELELLGQRISICTNQIAGNLSH